MANSPTPSSRPVAGSGTPDEVQSAVRRLLAVYTLSVPMKDVYPSDRLFTAAKADITLVASECARQHDALDALREADIVPMLRTLANDLERAQRASGVLIPTETHWIMRKAADAISALVGGDDA